MRWHIEREVNTVRTPPGRTWGRGTVGVGIWEGGERRDRGKISVEIGEGKDRGG